MTELTGGCACQAIRYECTGEPIVQLICHCRDCQRASGAAAATLMMVPADTFRFVKGKPAFYEITGGSGRQICRGFCSSCGSPVTGHWPVADDIQMIFVGSLDDPSVFKPQTELWLGSGHPWHSVNPDTLKFDGPPLSGVRDRLAAFRESRAKA